MRSVVPQGSKSAGSFYGNRPIKPSYTVPRSLFRTIDSGHAGSYNVKLLCNFDLLTTVSEGESYSAPKKGVTSKQPDTADHQR